MNWEIQFHDEFYEELKAQSLRIREALFAHAEILGNFGSKLGRPYLDTLNGSRYANMKELRFNVEGEVWIIAFVFDPERKGIL